MDDFSPFLPALQALGICLMSIGIPLFGFSQPLLRRLGGIVTRSGWRPFSPNGITLLGFFFTMAGIGLYLCAHPFWGFVVGGFGAILDRLDGRMAAALGGTGSKRPAPVTPWEILNFPGGTEFGKTLDALTDKVKVYPLLLYFALAGLLWMPWLVAMLLFDLFGTAQRWDWFARFRSDRSASGVGKLKTTAQWVVVIVCIPFDQQWPPFLREHADGSLLAANVALFASLLLAALSVLTKFKDAPGWLIRPLRRLDAPFRHGQTQTPT